MFRRAWKVITNNIGLKILALIFAVILWLVVVNVDDPKISQRFSASVVIENSEYLTDQGKYFEVLNDTNTIVFTVTAKRSYIEKLSNTDFKAVANMENAAIDNETGTGKVPIEVTALRYSTLVTISKATQNLEIALDNLAQDQFIVETDTTGTLPDGCALGDVTVSPNLLKVSGPESVVSRIDHVTASVDLTNMTTDIVASVIPTLYDSDGNIIDKSELTLNMSTVTVTARILDIKDVSLIFNVTGTPATGYAYMDMEYEPKTISIKGTASALNNVTVLNIPESALDISGAREDITQVVDITEYLPSGVTIADQTQAKVTVTVHVAQLSTKVVNIFPSAVQVLHLPDDYELTFDSAVIRVTLSGMEEDIEALDTSDIVASIDAGQLSLGTHEVELALELDDNIYHEPVTAIVTVTEKAQEQEPDTTESGNTTAEPGTDNPEDEEEQ
jgi:YbbR domain-containing protein